MNTDAESALPYQRTILYVDAYDSFSNNIVALLETSLGAHVTIVMSDAKIPDLPRAMACYDAVVLGPGPGDPTKSKDIELFKQIWQVDEDNCPPVLGICLGFQSLAFTFGATIERMKIPKHGLVTTIDHCPDALFSTPAPIDSTQYHSLRVFLNTPVEKADPLHPLELWDTRFLYSPSESVPLLMPLAWDADDQDNGLIVMAIKHTVKPFWGIQFHPESICSSAEAKVVIMNFWELALDYNRNSKRFRSDEEMTRDGLDGTPIFGLPRRRSVLQRAAYWKSLPPPTPDPAMAAMSYPTTDKKTRIRGPHKVFTAKVHIEDLPVLEVVEELQNLKYRLILLDSAVSRSEVGRYSVIGIVDEGTTKVIEHTSGESLVNISVAREKFHSNALLRTHKLRDGETVWDFLAAYNEEHKVFGGTASSPFWGGLMGYLSYESGMKTEYCADDCVGRGRAKAPDTVFAHVERSLVIDQDAGKVYIQSTKRHDGEWIKSTKDVVRLLVSEIETRKAKQERPQEFKRLVDDIQTHKPDFLPTEVRKSIDQALNQTNLDNCLASAIIKRPDEKQYKKKVRRCLEHIRAGDTYELCLTDQTLVLVRKHESWDYSWQLYKSLRRNNPAPFAAYLHLSDVTILSSSPERFLSWTRDGTCQLRPIKGTVKKEPGIDRRVATRILEQDKEQAENLMIVDLIRHDLHGVVGAGNVEVKKLMEVEEYETVFQLVSVIEGRFQNVKPQLQTHSQTQSGAPQPEQVETATTQSEPTTDAPFIGYTGLDVLQSAHPPGSMTGAPKLASCAILHKLEGHKPRGVYSGVIGYMCGGGGGDFSVLIRCAYRRDGEIVTTTVPQTGEEIEHEVWRVGAGGAVTALSDPKAEWDEMNAKLDSTLAAFAPSACESSEVEAGRAAEEEGGGEGDRENLAPA